MKIVDKLMREFFSYRWRMEPYIDPPTDEEIYKAGYQAAIDQLNAIIYDKKYYTHVATAKDFCKYLER